MVFNSFLYIISFFATAVLYYILPHKFRHILLLITSLLFYMAWDYRFLFLMLFTIYVNFITSKYIDKSDNPAYRKSLIIINFIISFGLLFVFKYFLFFTDSFNSISNFFGWAYKIPHFDIILPMGISFYTFQAVGYSIDVYRKSIKAETNYFRLALFLAFFPQLVAGPIERTEALMPQLYSKKTFEMENIIIGLKYMIFGFFKKIVIADRLAVTVNKVYNNTSDFDGLAFIIATFFFAFQIYCDFSGYSDIAKGSAKILGIDLMRNFDTPYFSKTIKEFWRRWHISLSSWFKDYLYFPLGGSRVKRSRKYLNMLITFFVSGLWHGANITFVIWGLIHGVVQIFEDIIRTPINKNELLKKIDNNFIVNIFKTFVTFTIVCISWIFFRANNLSDSIFILKNLTKGIENLTDLQYIYNLIYRLNSNYFDFIVSVSTILLLVLIEFFAKFDDIHVRLSKKPFIFRFIFYYIITILVFTLGVFSNASAFIYFQF